MVIVTFVSLDPEPRLLPGDVNMADVARHAGVSIATVSRALRDVPGVSEATRERIRHIATELSYVVSPEASSLARGNTGRVAVVVPDLGSWFYGAMLAAIQDHLHDAGRDTLLYQVRTEAERSYFFEHLPSRRKVDAVVLVALPMLQREVARLDHIRADVVVAGGRLNDQPHVTVDDHAIAGQAVDHLVGLGHRRIAMIRTSDTEGTVWTSDVLRQEGFRLAMARAQLPVPDDYLVTEPYGVSAGADAMARLLDLDEPPTAVFAYSDEIAISALQTVQRRGLRCPDDLSIVGVDGHPLAELFGLTTLDQHVERQAAVVAEMVTKVIDENGTPRREAVVAATLVVRSSTGPVPAHAPRSRLSS